MGAYGFCPIFEPVHAQAQLPVEATKPFIVSAILLLLQNTMHS